MVLPKMDAFVMKPTMIHPTVNTKTYALHTITIAGSHKLAKWLSRVKGQSNFLATTSWLKFLSTMHAIANFILLVEDLLIDLGIDYKRYKAFFVFETTICFVKEALLIFWISLLISCKLCGNIQFQAIVMCVISWGKEYHESLVLRRISV